MVQIELPEKKLSYLVSNYYDVILDQSSTFAQNRMVSLSIGHIVFLLKGKGRIETAKGIYQAEKHSLQGQNYPLFSFENEGSMHFCGIALKPSAPFKLFDNNIGELKNSFVDLIDLIGEKAPQTLEKLQQAASWPERIEVLSIFIEKQARNIPCKYDPIDIFVDHIHEKEGMITVRELRKRQKVSRRYIEKRFKTMLNITPGQFIRHVRLHFVCSKIARGEAAVDDILDDYGYYDRPHFMKQFKKHMNTPLSVLSNGQDNLFKEVYRQMFQT